MLRGKEFLGEVISCENTSTLAKVAEFFGYTISDNSDIISVHSDDSDDDLGNYASVLIGGFCFLKYIYV